MAVGCSGILAGRKTALSNALLGRLDTKDVPRVDPTHPVPERQVGCSGHHLLLQGIQGNGMDITGEILVENW